MHVRIATVRARGLGAALLVPALLLSAACGDSAGAGVDTPDAAPGSRAWREVLHEVREDFPDVPQMTTRRLAGLLESEPASVLLLDARSEAEYEVGHLRGALHAETLSAAFDALSRSNRKSTIVVYCSVGYRSSELAERLLARGVPNVFNLGGSIFRWANEGRPVYRGARLVHEVHPYDEDWAQLLDPRYRPD